MNLPGGQMFQSTADVGLASRNCRTHTTATTLAMTTDDRSNTFDTTSNAITATLPPVAECAGMMYFFYVTNDGGNDVTITDNGDDADFANVVIKAANQGAVLISDGIHWFAINSVGGNYGS